MRTALKYLVIGIGSGILLLFAFNFSYYVICPLKYRNHQEFAIQGIQNIEPAAQIEELFPEASHRIVYSSGDFGNGSVPTFNSEVYLHGRYHLTMQVPVEIRSRSEGKVAGRPTYSFLEIDDIETSSNGNLSVRYSRTIPFDETHWNSVYRADGDITIPELNLIVDSPIPNSKLLPHHHRSELP